MRVNKVLNLSFPDKPSKGSWSWTLVREQETVRGQQDGGRREAVDGKRGVGVRHTRNVS